MNTKLIFQTIVGATGYITWAIMAYLDPSQRADFLHFNVGMAVGTIGLVLRDMRASVDPVPVAPAKEGGHALTGMLVALAVVVALLLSGCASVQQAVQAYGSVAVTSARATSDTIIEAQKVSLCGLPLSAIARHPEIVPAVRSICLAPGDKTSAELLNATQASQTAVKP